MATNLNDVDEVEEFGRSLEQTVGALITRPLLGILTGSILGSMGSMVIPFAVRSEINNIKKLFDYAPERGYDTNIELAIESLTTLKGIRNALFKVPYTFATYSMFGLLTYTFAYHILDGKPENVMPSIITNLVSFGYEMYKLGKNNSE